MIKVPSSDRRRTTPVPRFRYESEMIPLLEEALPRLTFGRSTWREAQLFTEVPAVHGVPDLTAVRFNLEALAARRREGIRPLTTDAEVRVALALGSSCRSDGEIASRAGYSVEYVRRSVMPVLLAAGWADRGEAGTRRAPQAVWAARRVVTVEAKLRDWSRALSQARRQQLSADAAYVALEIRALASISSQLDRIAASGVGVIAVDPTAELARVLVRPRRVAPSRSIVGRMLIAERCADMFERGERAGQVYPVFGWTAPEL